ncbi:hypothetical protein, similar to cysteine desulfurase [Mycoplasma suis KI3806]|uniref:Uncharacterized protein n=1 Tax=Mycoplasma suis (strain KI_3806) TaxID=708248 RepID=F0V1K4_MYCS3|nr:hypothetical protein [Mycoplasma suis]CBZ40535.1 hypothetical protein, similar to cysteine desulfurase [Mycoplasma suis KI3806]
MKTCNYFFGIEEVIKKYYSEFAGSIQNKSHSKALEYSSKIEELRKKACSFLGLSSSHFLTFQHNEYYIEKLIFNFLKNSKNLVIFTNKPYNLKTSRFENVFEIENIFEIEKVDLKNKIVLIWLIGLESLDKKIISQVNKLGGSCSSLFSYISLDNIFFDSDESKKLLSEFSSISFNPSKLFHEYGTTFFWFKKEISLSPIFMGSNAAKLSSGDSLTVRELPYSLEIGTSNLISLLALEKIFSSISTEKLNFSFSSNCKF